MYLLKKHENPKENALYMGMTQPSTNEMDTESDRQASWLGVLLMGERWFE